MINRQIDRAVEDNSGCDKCRHIASQIGWAHRDLKRVARLAAANESTRNLAAVKDAKVQLAAHRQKALDHLESEHAS